MKFWLKYAMLWHRYLGIAACLFFGVWFVSGVVMMYAQMPELAEAERIARLPRLDLTHAMVTPGAALTPAMDAERIVMGMLGVRPVYRILDQSGGGDHWRTVFADDGTALRKLAPADSIAIARRFQVARDDASPLRWTRELTDLDQWTIYPSYRAYLPFEVIDAADSRATRYYVSAATGTVVLATTRNTRALAWLGAIPHWWYIRGLRAHTPLWRGVMIAASIFGTVMCVSGIVAGVLRYSPSKRYRFPDGRRSTVPHTGNKRWHYLLGYGFGLVTFTWIFSGLMSMNPGHWSPGPAPTVVEQQRFAGGAVAATRFTLPPTQAIQSLSLCLAPHEFELIFFRAQPYYLAFGARGESRLLHGDAAGACLSPLSLNELARAGQQAESGARAKNAVMLSAYDAYYYDQHGVKPLPVARVELDDAQQTWMYANPATGLIVARYTARSRAERWLYQGLHCLDFPFLYRHRPAWDIVVILLSIGGLVLSGTGVVLAAQYMRRTLRRKTPTRRAVARV